MIKFETIRKPSLDTHKMQKDRTRRRVKHCAKANHFISQAISTLSEVKSQDIQNQAIETIPKYNSRPPDISFSFIVRFICC